MAFKSFSSLLIFTFIIVNNVVFRFVSTENIDTIYPIVFEHPQISSSSSSSSSLFGHSVLMHSSDEYAPNATVNQSNNTGIIYHCDWSGTSSSNCVMIDLVNQMNENNLFTNKMHLGWNLVSRSKTNEFLTCAFSWTYETLARNRQNMIETWMVPNGACFLLSNYFKDDDFSREKPKLILPMAKDRPFKDNGDYLYAYAMAGFSATISTDQDNIYLGAPGYDDWRGAFAKINLNNFPSTMKIENNRVELDSLEPNERDVYLGYSITSGNYFQRNREMIVVGIPRKNLTGSVILFTKISGQNKIVLNGQQMCEYFGHSLLTIDANQDGFDDLLVAAPMYSSWQNNLYDEGRVFFYQSNRVQGFKEPKILSGDPKPMARFGTAMANLGDINKDRFPDIAIGAPYEDDYRGSVYIFRGSPQGILEKYVQKISAAKHLSSLNLNGFGYSFSSNVDIDNNEYNDLLCSLYLDPIFNRAFILQSIAGQSQYLSTNRIDQSFTLIPPQTKYCSDYYIVYFKSFDKIDNLFDSVLFELNYSLESDVNEHSSLNEEIFKIPILENEQISNISTELYFKMCNKTARDCLSNFRLEPSFIFDDDMVKHNFVNDSQQQFLEGEYQFITLLAKVINIGEPAFNAELILQTNANISLKRMDKKCNEIKVSSSNTTENRKYSCKLNSPLIEDDSIFLTFKSFEVDDTERVWFKLNITTSNNIDPASVHDYQINFQTIRKADFDLQIWMTMTVILMFEP
ncbi:hypothetical protein BLA29_001112 [Euroglyphus maynei]|uniref:Integrin alpha second immunoglobulin-like domain-containing protein n=1 Tax=Euroglyphus maynei TaxID=6958 RepID=A0A1Y3AWK9_EURMA|nr:hypothetical protein BLA29_001112 [Euroglyphus maynei]